MRFIVATTLAVSAHAAYQCGQDDCGGWHSGCTIDTQGLAAGYYCSISSPAGFCQSSGHNGMTSKYTTCGLFLNFDPVTLTCRWPWNVDQTSCIYGDTPIDPCAANPCLNTATCSQLGDSADYECQSCPAEFTGKNCDVTVPCSLSPCENAGVCEDAVDFSDFTCACPVGFTGATCAEIQTPPCDAAPCVTGTCSDSADLSSYTCACDAGVTGVNCEIEMPCAQVSPAPCGGLFACTDSDDYSTYTCACDALTTGQDCQINIPCAASLCQNGATCTNAADFLTFTCDCSSGFHGLLCTESTPCSLSPCQNGASCVDSVDFATHSCDCSATVFTGDSCEIMINPCDADPCQNDATCLDNGDGSTYTCTCPATHTGVLCEIPIPCEFPSNPCHTLFQTTATCDNSADYLTYTCTCDPASTYVGEHCDVQSTCQSAITTCTTVDSGATCTDLDTYSELVMDLGLGPQTFKTSDFECTCRAGFTGATCTETVTPLCQTANPCQFGSVCLDDINFESVTCDCTGTGYMGDHCDVPEPCTEDPCQNSGTCANSVDLSTYTCDCTTAPDFHGDNCEIEKPCSGTNPCHNEFQQSATCNNLADFSDYTCTCDPTDTYIAERCDTQSTCTTLTPCNGGTCNDLATFTTLNTEIDGVSVLLKSSDFECVNCPDGLTGTFCTDPTPCSANPCQNGGICADSADMTTYTCDCAAVADFYGQHCDIEKPCSGTNPCHNAFQQGAICSNSVDFTTFTCDCTGTNFIGDACDKQDTCAAIQPCQNGGTCILDPVGTTSTQVLVAGIEETLVSAVYTCDCLPGSDGVNCELLP